MPAAAYALLAVFTAVAAASGVLAARLVGPRRWWAAVAPMLASFGALYLVGHRFGWSLGPELTLFGFRVALLWDVVVALGTASGVALIQATLLRLLQPQQRGAGGHRSA